MGEMAKMDASGDLKIIWDADKPDEVEAARAQFKALVGAKAKGYAAFSVDKKGKQDEQIREFDPQAERIILVPQMQGG